MDYDLRAAKMRQAALISKQRGQVNAPLVSHLPPQPTKLDYGKLALKIMAAVSDSIPDGDPIDQLIPYLRRHGFDASSWMGSIQLNRACKLHLNCATYNQYLIESWDAYNELQPEAERIPNPWR